ncbi:tapasin-related protein-like isoform X2 [Boleophthalmus pectinirostris]|uniref:tapasin-related protein-like isoform X2 n=1 Tax=Boleophthalmus pectinirostris TaxID=150288 RepID=UPI00242DBCF6|nr:tapasin-related protein-like isoform X2 [Boleophthalmus pectinirostris]
MGLYLKLFIYVFLLRDIQSADQISWLPCRFTDEEVSANTKGYFDTKHHPRPAALQFGLKGDPPVDPDIVTFLITPSKLDLRHLLVGAVVEQLSCVLHRYSTDGSLIRWPVKGEHLHNRWFSVNISHSNHLFQITSFIRQSTDQPPTGQHDFKSWPVIQDKEILTTTVVMMIQTQTPVVKSLLNSNPKLHCQFYIDHKAPRVTVEWKKIHNNVPLFSHESPSGQTQGSGVELKQLAAGGATYTTPLTKVGSEGKYFCSVHVHPLLGSVTVDLKIEAPPHVSLNVAPTLTISEDSERRVECRADGYYPLDVDIQWSHKGSTEVGPRVDTAQLSGHSPNPDGTYSLFAFFYLKPKRSDSGRKFTCTVSHRALPAPITKTFTLHVTGQIWPPSLSLTCLK